MEGRGAWDIRGKRNDETYYKRVHDKPRDGDIPPGLSEEKSTWFNAVHFGVMAIQRLVCEEGFGDPETDITGVYSWSTKSMVQEYQEARSITAEGVTGFYTMTELLKRVIVNACEPRNINPKYLYGLARQESGLDPGAQGRYTPEDYGNWQLRTVEGQYPLSSALDPRKSAEEAGNRWVAAREDFSGKGQELRRACCILQHRSPTAAQYLYTNETYLGPESTAYVENVLGFAEQWVL